MIYTVARNPRDLMDLMSVSRLSSVVDFYISLC